jgi:hypothetical protein
MVATRFRTLKRACSSRPLLSNCRYLGVVYGRLRYWPCSKARGPFSLHDVGRFCALLTFSTSAPSPTARSGFSASNHVAHCGLVSACAPLKHRIFATNTGERLEPSRTSAYSRARRLRGCWILLLPHGRAPEKSRPLPDYQRQCHPDNYLDPKKS